MDTESNFSVTPPLGVGSLAPEFSARSTAGEIKLSDYRGRWLLFISHPADFTPVCTSEFIALQRALPDFDALGCDLLGLSVDSLYSHIAWVRDMQMNFDVRITFPIVEDVSMAVSKAYGMIHKQSSSTAAVRSVFFIDPQGIIRTLIHYPTTVGRSVQELLRVLNALQQTDRRPISTPEGWQPGDKAVLSPPEDQLVADERAGKVDAACWYLTPTSVNQ
jgi:peroxiredoxin (alkyl hydroperoxide reductase subunit C)